VPAALLDYEMKGACGALNFGDARCFLHGGMPPAHPPHKPDQHGHQGEKRAA